MKTLVLAATTALALAMSVGPNYAAEPAGNRQQEAQRGDSSSNTNSQCDNIRANRGQWGNSGGDFLNCGAK